MSIGLTYKEMIIIKERKEAINRFAHESEHSEIDKFGKVTQFNKMVDDYSEIMSKSKEDAEAILDEHYKTQYKHYLSKEKKVLNTKTRVEAANKALEEVNTKIVQDAVKTNNEDKLFETETGKNQKKLLQRTGESLLEEKSYDFREKNAKIERGRLRTNLNIYPLKNLHCRKNTKNHPILIRNNLN